MLKFIIGAMALVLGTYCHAATQETPSRKKSLTAFASDAELSVVLKRYAEELRTRFLERNSEPPKMFGQLFAPVPPPPGTTKVSVSGSRTSESVTNTQTAGVDEGGIVKVHGKHLVMLRRGRLFTVNIDQGQLQPVSAVDAIAPDADPSGSWYDEMLISGNTVVVIGFSYQRGGTEISLFDIGDDGALAYRATYHMRSNDYYSSRNYASRLIGSKLVFYTPLYLNPIASDPFAGFPALRKWRPDATPADFKRLAPASRIYRSPEPFDYHGGLALHTVTVCELARPEMTCEASAVLGPRGRIFYVAAESVYVWTSARGTGRNEPVSSGLIRIPLDGKAPAALKVSGVPVDQFSFLEGEDRHLNVLVRASANGEAMWGSERSSGDLALMRVPLDSFADGRDAVPGKQYQALPSPGPNPLHNRFVGDYLLYGSGSGWQLARGPASRTLYAQRVGSSRAAQEIVLPHGVDRIEAIGAHAVVIGAGNGDLHFSSISLGSEAALAQQYVRERAAQGESRSHGFFYKPESAADGVVGLPVRNEGQAASVLYLRNASLKLTELGSLAARPDDGLNDGCRASCVDWYGNARPLFLRGRVFALMGYELVEGKLGQGRIVESGRVSFARTQR